MVSCRCCPLCSNHGCSPFKLTRCVSHDESGVATAPFVHQTRPPQTREIHVPPMRTTFSARLISTCTWLLCAGPQDHLHADHLHANDQCCIISSKAGWVGCRTAGSRSADRSHRNGTRLTKKDERVATNCMAGSRRDALPTEFSSSTEKDLAKILERESLDGIN